MGASWGSAYAKCSDCAPEEFHAVPGEPETQRAAERELLESERNRYLAHANEGWALANERTRQLTAARAEAEQLRAELETERAAHVDAVADANEKMQRLRAELAEARGRFKQSDDTLETVRDTAERYRAELAAQIGRGDKYVSRAAHAEANAERYRVALNVADDAITDAINDYRDCECPGWSPGKPDTHGSCSKRELLIALQKVRAALSGSGAAPEGGTGGTR